MALTGGGKRPFAAPTDRRSLYPPRSPFTERSLSVGDGHVLHVEECGVPDAPVAVVLHGGPGGATSPAMRRFFDPERWRIVMFDQRGAGRSTPHASLEHNTTWTLVDDLERVRQDLGVETWTVFGGSWGSTLGLAYAETHPEHVAAMVLRGVFLFTPSELAWFYGGGAGAILPRAWDRFLAHLDPGERDDAVSAYYRRLTIADQHHRIASARSWTAWESAAITGSDTHAAPRTGSPAAIDALARIECHYVVNDGFMMSPNQLLENVCAIADIPGFIVQGRRDLVTPPRAACALADAWPKARLRLVEDAGHAASDPGIVDGLVRATDAVADVLAGG